MLFVCALASYGGGWDGNSPTLLCHPVLYFRMLTVLVKTESEGCRLSSHSVQRSAASCIQVNIMVVTAFD